MPDENPETQVAGRRQRDDALQLGPRKKASVVRHSSLPPCGFTFCLVRCISDPLISHGRHFRRTVHALCNVQALLTNGLLRLGEQADEPDESFTTEWVQYSHLISE
jgi:hypothetical protein